MTMQHYDISIVKQHRRLHAGSRSSTEMSATEQAMTYISLGLILQCVCLDMCKPHSHKKGNYRNVYHKSAMCDYSLSVSVTLIRGVFHMLVVKGTHNTRYVQEKGFLRFSHNILFNGDIVVFIQKSPGRI